LRVHGAPAGAPLDEPDLLVDVRRMLEHSHPGELLFFVSTLLAALEPARVGPFVRPADDEVPAVSLPDLVATFEDVDLAETTALLTVIAEMISDDVLRARIRREVAARRHRLPQWLTQLAPIAVDRAVEISHVLADGDNLVLGVRTSSGAELSVAVYIDHNLGTAAKDAFVLEDPLDLAVAQFREASGNDPDIQVRNIDPADARVRIEEAIDLGAITFPPLESETWPACRPLVTWVVRQLPAGGQGYVRPEWSDADRADLVDRFLASPVGRVCCDDEGEHVVDTLLWFGCDYGPGDPLRWSPTAVEILLTDWLPRKVVADVGLLEQAPDVLRAFIRFCHAERGVRESLTVETLAAVDELEPEYQRAIRSPRPQGPAALLAAAAAADPDGPWELDLGDVLPSHEERVRDALGRAVGGDGALQALDADPLPDEPFAWDVVADDIRDRVEEVLALTDGCCDELLDVEYRTACRRLLADVASADPEIFRRRGRADTAAAAIAWIMGKANRLFDTDPAEMSIKHVVGWFGVTGSPSTRAVTMLRALGVDAAASRRLDLGTPRYLVSKRRRDIVELRDEVEARLDEPSAPDEPVRPLPEGIDPAPDPWTPQPVDAVRALGWFPRDEFGVALDRWPQLATHWGTDDYATYVRMVQAQLLDTSRALGQHPDLVPIRVDELERHATRTGADPASSSARATFVADAALRDEGIAWPPRRNDSCWCGSGRKYKKCCDTVLAGHQAYGEPTAVDQRSTAYELDVRLASVSPPVWRRFQIRAGATFLDLHHAIQFACGWDDSHLFRFSTPDGQPIARAAYDGGFGDQEPDAETVLLSSYFGRHDQCVYEYDFGDGWMHEIVVRERIDRPVAFHQRLVDGRRAFPPEDCGGLYGYEQCVDVATGAADSEGLGEWLGDWDPEHFDVEKLKRHFDR
jgi:energy-converting hydrogenase Eha subunit E